MRDVYKIQDMYNVVFDTTDEIVRYIKSMSLYCVEREGKYINFPPVVLSKYFSSDRIKGEYFDGNRYREITLDVYKRQVH